MYYEDHAPPHFHVEYGDCIGVFSIEDLKLIRGILPGRVSALVVEWAFEHREELLEDWRLAAAHKPLEKIDPLT